MIFHEMVNYLGRVSDEAYYEYEKYKNIDWPYAVKFGRIVDKLWNMRSRIAKDVRGGLL